MKSCRIYLEKNSQPILIIDEKNNIIFYNAAAAKLILSARNITVEKIIPIQGCSLIYITTATQEDISLMVHQLRSPLVAIKWTAESILENPKLDEKTKSQILNISDSIEILIKLVRDLLAAGKISSGKLTPQFIQVSIPELIGKIISVLKPLAEKNGQKVNLRVFGMYRLISADPDLLGQAVSNILDNAINYSLKDSEINISCSYNDKFLTIAVQSAGPQIPEEEQKFLFSKFFRSDAAKKIKPTGSGLGLYIAKSIVEAHRGRIRCESDDKSGTIFFIEIPIYK